MNEKNFPDTPFERYADAIILHCVSENWAYFMKSRIAGRLNLFELVMNAEKTRLVYMRKDSSQDHRDH